MTNSRVLRHPLQLSPGSLGAGCSVVTVEVDNVVVVVSSEVVVMYAERYVVSYERSVVSVSLSTVVVPVTSSFPVVKMVVLFASAVEAPEVTNVSE